MTTTTTEELKGARRLLRRINQSAPDPETMKEFAAACGRLPKRLQGFEGYAILSGEYFRGELGQGQSAFFRMEALARTVSAQALPGWTKPARQRGVLLTHDVLFAAAAITPVLLKDGQFCFSRAALLKSAFQLAKDREND
jgi:hypothetical protein